MEYLKSKQKQSKNSKKYSYSLTVIAAIIGAVVIYILYKIPSPVYWFESPWSAGDALGYYGVVVAAIVTIRGLRLTFEDNRDGIKEQGRLDKLPVLAVTTLNKTARIPWLNVDEPVHAETKAVQSDDEKYYYKEFRLENLFFVVKKDKITVTGILDKKQQDLVVHEGFTYASPANGLRISQFAQIVYIPLDIANVGNGAALNLRIGLNNVQTNDDEKRYITSINMAMDETIYIGIYLDQPNDGSYERGFYYDDVFENHYKQINAINISHDENNQRLVKFTNIVKQERVIK